MKRTRLGWLLAALCLTIFAPAASACINDGGLVPTEREFKSRYLDQQPPPPQNPGGYPSKRLLVYGLSGGGTVMLAGALTVTLWRRRREGAGG
jgi:hypothetical protein